MLFGNGAGAVAMLCDDKMAVFVRTHRNGANPEKSDFLNFRVWTEEN